MIQLSRGRAHRAPRSPKFRRWLFPQATTTPRKFQTVAAARESLRPAPQKPSADIERARTTSRYQILRAARNRGQQPKLAAADVYVTRMPRQPFLRVIARAADLRRA